MAFSWVSSFLALAVLTGTHAPAANPVVLIPLGEPTLTLASGANSTVTLRVRTSGGSTHASRAVTWQLQGPGKITPEERRDVKDQPGVDQYACAYRPPRAGGVTASLVATSVSDPALQTVFTLNVEALHEAPPAPAVDLLPLLSHTGADYHQGGCTNCYAWAANTALEAALATRYGIRDRLSVQYFNQIFPNQAHAGPRAPDPCEYQHFHTVFEAYLHEGRLIPWSNPHGGYALGATRQVGLFPYYRVLGIASMQIDLANWTAEEAIAELKHRLTQQDVVIFLRNAHYTALVGYDATDPDPARHYWKVLDSLHRPSGGSDPTWHLPMRSTTLNYDPNLAPSGISTFYYVSDLELDLGPAGPPHCEVAGTRLQAGEARLQPGEALELEATAEGRPPMTYQWFKDGQDLPGQTRSVLELPAVTLADAGAYGVRVGSGGLTASSPLARVDVAVGSAPSSLTVVPGDLTLPVGGSRPLRAYLTGLSDPRVHWTLEGGGKLSASTGNPVTFKAPLSAGSSMILAQSAQNPTLAFQVPIQVKSLDINGDGHVDVLDLAALAQAYGSARGEARYLGAADFTGNARVNREDVLAFLSAWDAHP